ncbi:MAG: hypothetical protein R3E86_10065 [Pseudomonadales bacterium]
MFNAKRVQIDGFVEHAARSYREVFPGLAGELEAALERAARTALGTLLNCDCPYHDLEHTILVTDAGMDILRGRMQSRGDITPREWLQAITAMLCHDLGYMRGLLRGDGDGSYIADRNGGRISPPPGTTDAFMMPYHVDRSRLFVVERFAGDREIEASVVANHIEMTRFPVPAESFYHQIDSIGALVRAADLIGQMGDPSYPMKHPRLFAEFSETGEAARLGYDSALDLRRDFPEFFYTQVYPYLGPALDYLQRTPEGRQWIASLFHHVHATRDAEHGAWLPERNLYDFVDGVPRGAEPRPHIAVSNK